jgi:magnesium chelatase family protein
MPIKGKREGLGFSFLQNVKEAAVAGLDVYGVENVQEVIDFLEGKVQNQQQLIHRP